MKGITNLSDSETLEYFIELVCRFIGNATLRKLRKYN